MKDFFVKYARFIVRGGPDDCWPWIGSTTPEGGYGRFTRDNEHCYAHRSAFECEHGEGSADGLLCRHKCDNPPCCNPNHILLGTHKDNVHDAIERGRARKAVGEEASGAKLTETLVLKARQLAASGHPIARILEQIPGVSHGNMKAAVTGRHWAHLPGAVTELAKAKAPGPKPGSGHKLTEAEVSEIKRGLRDGVRGVILAEKCGVTQGTISAIKVGRIWSHVA